MSWRRAGRHSPHLNSFDEFLLVGLAGIGPFGTGTWWRFNAFAGIVVLVGAVMLYVRPKQRRSWGVVILIVSLLVFLSGMMGVIGGVLALAKD
jgi:hypothetical protein